MCAPSSWCCSCSTRLSQIWISNVYM